MHISNEDRSKLYPKSKNYVFVGYAKDVKWFKLGNQIKNKIVICKYVVFNEKLMLKQSTATDVLASDEETLSKYMIHVKVDISLVNNLQVVHGPEEELGYDT